MIIIIIIVVVVVFILRSRTMEQITIIHVRKIWYKLTFLFYNVDTFLAKADTSMPLSSCIEWIISNTIIPI